MRLRFAILFVAALLLALSVCTDAASPLDVGTPEQDLALRSSLIEETLTTTKKHHKRHHRHNHHNLRRHVPVFNDENAENQRFAEPQQQQTQQQQPAPAPMAPQIPWLTIAIVFLCVAVTVFLCFFYRKQIPACVSWVEDACHKLFVLLTIPIKWTYALLKMIFYPVKEAAFTCYDTINEYYHPYIITA